MSSSIADILRQERPVYRRYVTIQSALMKALCVVFTAAILLILAFITFYLLANGFKYLSWNIFTQVPIPVGMEGSPGGLKNALVGTLILIGLASAIGIPLGVLAGIFFFPYSARALVGSPARGLAPAPSGGAAVVFGGFWFELVVLAVG